ncbi:MAG: aminotransferase class I/II-fold pyridoxal phosphate-dependent enzyme [Bacilli bacterium]|jgi:8-amino-7-oxononanoate synthase|nr:aminotransferase class I/II-fold pyridoxal phosphate-dependent enzyme [Acholeplasmataceae bacterium]
MDIFKKCSSMMEMLREVREKEIYPYFHALETGQDTVVRMNNRETIMIGSNNYLGLTSHPEVIEAGVAAIKKYGSGCSGSRFLNGTLDIHLALESELAEFLGKEDVMTFSTGFQSNLGILSAIAGRNDVIVGDRENHASIYDGCRLSYAKFLRYNHNDMEDLENTLKSIPEDKGILIVTDGAFSMTGDIANLPEIVRLAKKYGARVMVDDAHGFGVLGEHGRGTAEHFGLEDEVDIIMGTFSKSLASLGGFMAASKEVVDYVKHVSRPFIFSASISPANVECARAALRIIKREPERIQALRDISNYMREGLKKLGVDIIESETPIIPIYTYEEEKTFIACKLLLERGVYVNPVIPPATPPGQCLLRTSYTATHTKEHMDYAMQQIKEVLEILKNLA